MNTFEDEEGEAFLAQYNIKERRKRDAGTGAGGRGNFVVLGNGDIVSSRPISKHAQQRAKERGVSISDVLKGKPKSGAIVSDGGKVITVIPEAWKNNAGTMLQTKVKERPEKPVYHSNVPHDKLLPKGNCILSLNIASNTIGVLLGKKHSNIKKMTQGCPGTQYELVGNDMTIWGPEENVKKLMKDIEIIVNDINGFTGPPIPEEKLPCGQIKRRILVAGCNIGHVIGKGKKNLVKMRDDHPAVSINFNCKSGDMYVWGDSVEVNKVCGKIASVAETANKMRARDNAKREKMGKASYDKKISQYVKDKKTFQKVDAKRGREPGDENKKTSQYEKGKKTFQKAGAHRCKEPGGEEITATEMKISERSKKKNCAKEKKMKKRKELQKKKRAQRS